MSLDDTNLELITLIWLDKLVDATQENREFQDKLRSIINYLKIFDNCQECNDFIKNKINERQDKIILIVSGQLGQQIVKDIHDLRQIISIFVFCGDKERNERWAKEYKKIRNVIVKFDDLLKEIEIDKKSDEQKLNESIELLNNKDKIVPFILQIDYSIIDKKEFLDICFKQYKGNLIQIENIKEFEHLYSSSNALNYFFNQTFLYQLLIKSLHLCNIQIIFLLRFFLQDIEEQIKNCSTISERVYRGQLMTIDQIDYLNQYTDQTILRFNSFIIANQNQEQVLNSLQNSPNTNGLHKVLFEIEINQIGKVYKQYIIFPITTYFKIISIKFEKRIWIVKINVFNSNQFSKKFTKKPIQLAHLLREIGQFDQSEKFFSLLLNQYPSLNAECYDGLGRIAQDKGLYDISLQFYKKSLQIVSFQDRPHCLNNIGCAYDYLEQYQQALQYYFQALTFMKTDQNQAMCLNNIAITYAKIQQYDKAIEYFNESLSKRKKSLLENHQDIGISYTNLGVIYSSLGKLDNALEYFNFALKSFQSNKSNIFTAILYQNMAKIFQDKIQLNKALQFYQDSLNIFKQLRPSDHPNIIYIQHQIQQLKQQ